MRLSLVLQRFGRFDVTAHLDTDRGIFRKQFSYGGEPSTITLTRTNEGLLIGGDKTIAAQWHAAIQDDGYEQFQPPHPLVQRLMARHRGLRVFIVPWLFDVACAAVLQQRVTFREAVKQFSLIAKQFGSQEVGSREGRGYRFPTARELSDRGPGALRRFGVDNQRARTLIALARAECRRPFLNLDHSAAQIKERLRLIDGIGPWTIGMIGLYGCGDTDAVPVGDVHLPSVVSWLFHQKPSSCDDEMLSTLAQFAGQRGRVLRLASSEQSKRKRVHRR